MLKKVCLATLVKNQYKWLRRFLTQIEKLNVDRYVFLCGENPKDLQILYAWKLKHKNCHIYIKEINEDNRLKRLAKLRNILLDLATKNEYVFMVDSDIIKIPKNLVSFLLSLNKDIIAPFVYIEKTFPLQFYDTFAFRDLNGCRYFPFMNIVMHGVFEASSVGSCVLISPQVKAKVRFESDGKESEWVMFCRKAREQGFKVWVCTKPYVLHANLPEYGEAWH